MYLEKLIYRCGEIGATYKVNEGAVSVKYNGFVISNMGKDTEAASRSLLMTLGGL